MDESSSKDFLVRRTNLSDVRWARAQTRADRPPADGEALLRVDRYVFSANNISYALCGALGVELGRYWDFFPTGSGWGRIPVWGYADVVASHVPGLPEGQRVFGYMPISTCLKVQPAQVTELSFDDASEHRRELPALYQTYTRVRREDANDEDVRAILQLVLGTGCLLDEWLHEHDLFGARQVLVASASSKTALCIAFLLARRAGRAFELIGLTSARHRAFCERVGYYDRVLEYAEVQSLPAQTPTVFVDMSGSPELRLRVHEHFQAALRYSSAVGLTHGKIGLVPGLPGPKPQVFSVPALVARRPPASAALRQAQREAQAAFYASALEWLELVRVRGPAAIEATYLRVLRGQIEPHQAVIMSL